MAIQSLLVLLAAPLVASYSLPAVSTATRSSRAVSASAPLSSIRMQEAEAEAPPEVTAPDAYIEFIIGYPEPVVPDVSLTRSRDGSTGVATFTFDNPSFLAASTEALGLAAGMAVKHDTFYTGFSGAKLVCASSKSIADWSADDKQHLLDEASEMLRDLGGAMFTGCDMNTTTGDMAYLHSRCPYVLAAIGNAACCPNTATAYGVLGGLEASTPYAVAVLGPVSYTHLTLPTKRIV